MSDFLKGKDLRVEIGGTVAQQNNASEHWGWGWDWDSLNGHAEADLA